MHEIIEMAASASEDKVGLDKRQNVFASPWKKSDVVLVIEETEFHVHRYILMLQSPVFEAMLDGHFKETSQKKITLEGKTSEDMLQFLKLLYPHNMIKEPLISLTDENAFKMLVLADEYQAEDVINQCLEEVKVTAENAFRVLPYASKYNQSVREKCFEVIKRSVPTKKVQEESSKLDNELNEVVKELLLTKCRFLESVVQRGNDLIITLLKKFCGLSTNSAGCNNCCGHGSFSVTDFSEARKCEYCLKAYRERFTHNIYSIGKNVTPAQRDSIVKAFIDLLKDTDDVTESVTKGLFI